MITLMEILLNYSHLNPSQNRTIIVGHNKYILTTFSNMFENMTQILGVVSLHHSLWTVYMRIMMEKDGFGNYIQIRP